MNDPRLLVYAALLWILISCSKENIVEINPFQTSKEPTVEVVGTSINFSVNLVEHAYSSVKIYYSYNLDDLAKGVSSKSFALDFNNREYTGVFREYERHRQLYYRVAVELQGQSVLSPIYKLPEDNIRLKVKDDKKWLSLDPNNTFKVVLIGKNLDKDISQYSFFESSHEYYKIEKIDVRNDGYSEITVLGTVHPLMPFVDFVFEIHYKGIPIFFDYHFKLAPPPGFGLYHLTQLSYKSFAWPSAFVYKDELYSITNEKIEKYDFQKHFWALERVVDSKYHIGKLHSYLVNDTLVINGIESHKPTVNVENRTTMALKLNLTTFEIETVYLKMDKVFDSFYKGTSSRLFKLGNEQFAIIQSDENNTGKRRLYSVDWNRRKMTYKTDFEFMGELNLFEHQNKTYVVTNDDNRMNNEGIYSFQLYQINLSNGSMTLLKDFVGTNRNNRFFTFLKNEDNLILVGQNRTVLGVNLNDLTLTQYLQQVSRDWIQTNAYFDNNEFQGQLIKIKDKYYFTMGGYTPGVLSFTFPKYD